MKTKPVDKRIELAEKLLKDAREIWKMTVEAELSHGALAAFAVYDKCEKLVEVLRSEKDK